MIKIATAECFTQGKIGRELHALAQSYEGNFGAEYIETPKEYGDFDYNDISVTCSLFIPTIEAVKKVLNVENPPKPKKLIKGIKVYDEAGDKSMSKIMAKAVKELSGCDIAIGTTAGIGRGGISIITPAKLQQQPMFMPIYVKITAKNYTSAAKMELKKHWR